MLLHQKSNAVEKKRNRQTWHNVVTRNKLAEICEKYLSKGDRVYIEGRIKTRQWEQDGIKRYTTEIHAIEMNFLTTKKDLNTPETAKSSHIEEKNGKSEKNLNDEVDDLPF